MAQEDLNTLIREMQEDSGIVDFIPTTIRLRQPALIKINKFCETTGIVKAVLIRRLIGIGWHQLFEEDLEHE